MPRHSTTPAPLRPLLRGSTRCTADFVAGVRSLGDPGLAEPQGHRSPPAFAHAPVARVVLYMSVEAFHHGAEVCLLRDLYLASTDRVAATSAAARW